MNINIISFNNSICDFVYIYHGLALVKSVEFTINNKVVFLFLHVVGIWAQKPHPAT